MDEEERKGFMLRKRGHLTLLSGLFVLGLLSLSLYLQMEFPKTTGPYAVGRTSRHWVDSARREVLSSQPGTMREVPLQIWYPAEPGTGSPAPYFPNLDQVAQGLSASGEVPAVAVFGLRWIRSSEHLEAELLKSEERYPVVILSPGAATNVEFYAGIAGELASHGYIVIGINHPYDVAAVALQDGSMAQFISGPLEFEAHEPWVAERISVRTDDVRFILRELTRLNESGDTLLSGRMDLDNVGVMGHSLGGITAAESCRVETMLRACLNIDGIQRGGPFSTQSNPTPPNQPFMMITKEQNMPPASIALFQTIPSGSYLVVIDGATHNSFTDGPLLSPALLPLPDTAQRILSQTRLYTLAFFDKTLKHLPAALLDESFEDNDVSLKVFSPQ